MRMSYLYRSSLVLFLTWLTVGCSSQPTLTPEQKAVKAAIENAHKGESVTFEHWSQSQSADVDIKDLVAAKFAEMRKPLDAAIRESREPAMKSRDESLAHRKSVRDAWRHDDETIAERDEWRAGVRKKWEAQDREWQAADKAGKPQSPTRAAEVKERLRDQQALARWKPDEDAQQATRAEKQPKLEAEWKAEDEEWNRLKQTWDDEDHSRVVKHEQLTAATPEMTLVRVKYRALNRVGQNELADAIFGVKESKATLIADRDFIEWVLPRMDKMER